MFKKVTVTAALLTSACIALPAYATTVNGLYMGLQLGQSDADYSSSTNDILAGSSVDNKSWAGRIYGGYQFNKFIAAEFGYTYLGKVGFNDILGVSGADADLQQQALDLTAKIMLPITRQFQVFALLGGDYMMANVTNISSTADNLGISGSGSQTAFGGTYGLGAEYDFNPNWGIDGTWRHFGGNNGIQNTDLFTLGIAWHF